jgi:ribosome-associated protein
MLAVKLFGAVGALWFAPSGVIPPQLAQSVTRADTPRMNDFAMTRPAKAFTDATGGSAPNSRKRRRENLLQQLEEPLKAREPEGAPEEDPAAPLTLAAVRAADARKAKDIVALRVGHLTSAANFFVNVVGGSKAQINAIVKNIEDEVEEQFGRWIPAAPRCAHHWDAHPLWTPHRVANRQGKALSGWVCLDYDEVVINVFSEKERDFYGVEKFWAAAQTLDLSDVILPNLAGPDSSALDDEDDDAADDDWAFGSDDDWDLSEDEWSFNPEVRHRVVRCAFCAVRSAGMGRDL